MAAQRIRGAALIVEDDVLLALALEHALRDAGLEDVQGCASAAEAMDHLARMQPAVLVLDVNLSDRNDGWALAELACQVCLPPPLIVFSTAVPDAVPGDIAALGHVLAKPYEPVQLTRLVRQSTSGGVMERIRRILG